MSIDNGVGPTPIINMHRSGPLSISHFIHIYTYKPHFNSNHRNVLCIKSHHHHHQPPPPTPRQPYLALKIAAIWSILEHIDLIILRRKFTISLCSTCNNLFHYLFPLRFLYFIMVHAFL